MILKKKVLFVVTKSVWGGAQRYIYDLATHLPRERYEVMVAAGGGGSTKLTTGGSLFSKLQHAGIRIIGIPGLDRDIKIVQEFFVFWQLLILFLREKPDIIHLSSSKAGGLGAVAAFLYRTLHPRPQTLNPRTIFTAHGWAFFEERPRWQNALIRFFTWLGALFQDRIILLDREDFETALHFIPKRKCVLIPNGSAPPEFLPRIEARRILSERIGRPIPDNTILIGTIAELTKNKGISFLIEALRHLPPTSYPLRQSSSEASNLQAIIIGDGELRNELTQKTKELGLEDIVFFAGFIPDASHYLPAFDIFVLPSLKEGLPYSIMEAMAAGVPVVATRVGGIPDMITDGREGVLVEPRNPNFLADAVGRLMQNTDLRRALGSAARARAARDFSLPRMVERTVTLYDPVIQPRQ